MPLADAYNGTNFSAALLEISNIEMRSMLPTNWMPF